MDEDSKSVEASGDDVVMDGQADQNELDERIKQAR